MASDLPGQGPCLSRAVRHETGIPVRQGGVSPARGACRPGHVGLPGRERVPGRGAGPRGVVLLMLAMRRYSRGAACCASGSRHNVLKPGFQYALAP